MEAGHKLVMHATDFFHFKSIPYGYCGELFGFVPGDTGVLLLEFVAIRFCLAHSHSNTEVN